MLIDGIEENNLEKYNNYLIYLKKIETLDEKYIGYYMIVNNKDSVFISEVESGCFNEIKNDNFFIGKIGFPRDKLIKSLRHY